ncbi:MAG: xanthine dehydrogenase family protein subunit M [Actinomycetota bacterium]|nr:xanthine dehydrogenase family protein subunit M [Actinomycetota bacterium]
MFPRSFDYLAPESMDDALSMLAEHGEDAKVLAGGQSLIPLMKLRFAAPDYIIDINRIPDLGSMHENGSLSVGALVRTHDIERSELIKGRYPAMAAAAPLISDPLVRNLGTVVGSLCHADPQGDWASVMLAMNAEIVCRTGESQRRIPVAEFVQGPFTTSLEPNEIATEVNIPDPGADTYGTYMKLERKVGDFASVGVAIHLSFDGPRVERAGIGLTAVGPANIKATEAEQLLTGAELDGGTIARAADLCAEAADPHSDLRGSADYKRAMVRVFVSRALSAATAGKAA